MSGTTAQGNAEDRFGVALPTPLARLPDRQPSGAGAKKQSRRPTHCPHCFGHFSTNLRLSAHLRFECKVLGR